MFKDLIASFPSITRVDKIRKLIGIVAKDREFKEEFAALSMALEYFNSYGTLPMPVQVVEKFKSFEGGSVHVDGNEYIDKVVAAVQDQMVRRDLMTLASKPHVSLGRIDEIKKNIQRVNNAKFVSIQEMDGKSNYAAVKEKPAGMKWFIDVLDEEISGASYGTITTLFGFTASLKTTTALSMVYSNAKDLGYNTAVITLEVPKKELYFNLLSRHALTMDPSTKITAKRIKKAMLSDDEESVLWGEVEPDFHKLKGKIFILDRGDICDCITGDMTDESFLTALTMVDEQCDGLDAFVVDYVNLTKYFQSSNAFEQGVNAFIGFLNDVVIKFHDGKGLIGIVLAQGNREGWKKACRKGGRYTIDALAEFNQMEQSSYYVIALFLDEALKASGEVKVQLLKHRAGNTIEEPFTTLTAPENFFVGDMQEYKKTYSEATLDEVLLD